MNNCTSLISTTAQRTARPDLWHILQYMSEVTASQDKLTIKLQGGEMLTLAFILYS